jgi:hypothetical protein
MAHRERPDDVDALAHVERASDHLLRQLIRYDRRRGDGEQRYPFDCSGAERSLCREDRSNGVRRRADANVGHRGRPLVPGGFDQRRSCARLSSMQSVAHGTA